MQFKTRNKYLVLILLAICISTLVSLSATRGPNDFNNDFEGYVSQFEEQIGDQIKCKEILSSLRTVSKEVTKYFSAHPKEVVNNKKLISDLQSFKNYVACITNSNSTLMDLADFKIGCRLIGGSFNYLQKGEYCIEVLKHRVGKHLCYLAFNTDYSTGKNYEINYILDTPSLNKKGKLSSIALPGKIDVITDNREWTDEQFLKITKVECQTTKW
jgi:hypothetical protein